MKKYRLVDVSEKQLEDLVRRAPELIEEGLTFVDHQTFTPRGPLDVLMVDSGHALVVAELKIVEDDGMLVQGIDYYDYVIRNHDGFARAYRQHKIDTGQEARLFLIAPSFSVALLNRIKWINMPISLFTFQCLEFEDAKGDIIPVYKEVSAPGRAERVEAYTLEDRYGYITNPEVRDLAKQIVGQIIEWDPRGVTVDATKYSISIKLSGRVLAYLEPRRKYFLLSMYDADGNWVSPRIQSAEDWEEILPTVRSSFDNKS